jgi:hypothetical protein
MSYELVASCAPVACAHMASDGTWGWRVARALHKRHANERVVGANLLLSDGYIKNNRNGRQPSPTWSRTMTMTITNDRAYAQHAQHAIQARTRARTHPSNQAASQEASLVECFGLS